MRSPRLVLLLLCFVALPVFLTFFSLLHSHPRHRLSTESTTSGRKSGIGALFSFHTPSSLFPPSAIISLTDDNSTFFLARPAAFGPLLPSDGLNGQLWVGSGFGEDNVGRGGVVTGAEGELGCSDVPGWTDGNRQQYTDSGTENAGRRKTVAQENAQVGSADDDIGKQRRSEAGIMQQANDGLADPSEGDGTDDHLHHPLQGSQVSKPPKPGQSEQSHNSKDGRPSEHADIQSLQESAEIAGKVVLLSRGGCGFLEKVKWVQRRGGVALIVGDDTRGGGLVTMYARGDTSNVTIASLFTSHTTAHLLSSLIPFGGYVEDIPLANGDKRPQSDDRTGKPTANRKAGKKNKASTDGTTFTAKVDLAKQTSTPRPSIVPAKTKSTRSITTDTSYPQSENVGWLRSVLSIFGFGGRSPGSQLPADSRRPPSSGRLNWIMNEDWDDGSQGDKQISSSVSKGGKGDNKGHVIEKPGTQQSSSDDFVIGVQDWRDPDLVGSNVPVVIPGGEGKITSSKSAVKPKPSITKTSDGSDSSTGLYTGNGLSGGSITPGSGEYGISGQVKAGAQGTHNEKAYADSGKESYDSDDDSSSWLSQILWGDEDDENLAPESPLSTTTISKVSTAKPSIPYDRIEEGEDDEHEGLWVTLTPTTLSTSPFFDTLLVLVVSPLVTLTVVYALLLLRGRIRRRRWRAPKSVVDRLPVRTYHTMPSSSSSTSSLLASPRASSPLSPLLQQTSPQSVPSRARPRSRTTSGIGAAVSASLDNATARATVSQHEKGSATTPWKKRYTGKQVECVVCLEEYVDGQSRVMSLPCGHEFHAECMYVNPSIPPSQGR